MKSFRDYYDASKRKYSFVIKIATDEINSEQKSVLESSLVKYDILSFSNFKETPYQLNPLDFPNIPCSKVFIAEIEMVYPATPDLLRNYISKALCIKESNVLVFTSEDPRLEDAKEFVYRQSKEYKDNYKQVLGSEEIWKTEAPYGDESVKEALAAAPAKEDSYVTNNLIPAQKLDKINNKEVVVPNNNAVIGTNDYRNKR
ncbi:hypothetical protein Paride_0514 [Pseudomonas phage Paride]|nr:hypothetical protein Paride_0514 [Pseudomonas phage Paride]